MESTLIAKANDRRFDVMRRWVGGVNSQDFPTDIGIDRYAWGENVVHRGGLIQTRPGWDLLINFATIANGQQAPVPSGFVPQPQGFTVFHDRAGDDYFVFAVNGAVFVSAYPYVDFVQMAGVQFAPDNDRIYFETATKAVVRNADNSLTIVDPYPVLMMSDGQSAVCYWDGSLTFKAQATTATFATVANSQTLTTATPVWFPNGTQVTGTGIAAGATIINAGSAPVYSGSNYTLQLSDPATASNTNLTLAFSIPTPQGKALTNVGPTVIQDNDPPNYCIRQCSLMQWTGTRLWVVVGTKVYASDFGDPFSFYEDQAAATASGFEIGEEPTGMVMTADLGSLFVFTKNTTTAFRCGIIDRSLWQTTVDFQQVVLPGIGCTAAFSIINKGNRTWWYSQDGWIAYDSATTSYISGLILPADSDMLRSKSNLSPDLSGICAGEFENYILVSVPSGDIHNGHTWALDQLASPRATAPTWSGAWTGVRPVQWQTTEINGERRCFFLGRSYSSLNGSQIGIWEAFNDSRTDNGGPIACQFETAIVEPTGDFREFKFAELDLIELLGSVAIQIYYGGIKGPFVKILDTVLEAQPGSIASPIQTTINTTSPNSVLQAFVPQSRTISTETVSDNLAVGGAAINDVVGIESTFNANIDKGFGLLVAWQGRMGIRVIRLVTEDAPQRAVGISEGVENEAGDINIVTQTGEGMPG